MSSNFFRSRVTFSFLLYRIELSYDLRAGLFFFFLFFLQRLYTWVLENACRHGGASTSDLCPTITDQHVCYAYDLTIPTLPPCRGTSIDSRRGFAVEADRRFFGSKCVMGRLIARSAKKATRRSTQSPNMPRPNAPLFLLPAFASESLLSPRSRLPAFVGRAGTTLCETIASLRTA